MHDETISNQNNNPFQSGGHKTKYLRLFIAIFKNNSPIEADDITVFKWVYLKHYVYLTLAS